MKYSALKYSPARFFRTAAVLSLVASSAFAQESKPAAPKPADTKPAAEPAAKPASTPSADSRFVLGETVKSIDGKDVKLADYTGKVVMIVNVASNCGYTKQYEGLQKLYEQKKDKGFVILGFPANNFNSQEPGTNEEIAKFCESKFSVTFPMFAKISVKGTDQHPLFKKLSNQPAPVGGDPKWNFTKFVIDRDGHAVARFDSSTTPEDKALVAKVDELLAKGSGEKPKPADTKPAEKPASDKK